MPLVLLAAAILGVVLLAGGPGRDGPPLDPTSSGALGTKALVDVLDELGVRVRVTDGVAEDDTVALLLDDALASDEETDELRRWVSDGGTLVVADPLSSFTPEVAGTASIGPLRTSVPRECDAAALAGVARVAAGGGVVYAHPGGPALTCFPRGEGHWLVATPEGAGTVVALGGPEALTNGALGEADNGVLAAALLAPDDDTSLAFLQPGAPGEGEASLAELVADRVWYALAQLLVAFLAVVAWRARRLGAPVGEPQPVQVAGSELVAAVGNLLQQTGARGQAGRLLREDVRRTLAERLGLPPDSPPEVVAEAASRRSGQDAAELTALLAGPDPADEATLVALAHDLETARGAALAPRASSSEQETHHVH